MRGADDLWWILGPTAQLVGVDDRHGVHDGARRRIFLARASVSDREIVRGINFMMAAFGMLVFALFHRVGSAMLGGARRSGSAWWRATWRPCS